MNKPFDPRLLQHSRSSRGPMLLTVALTIATTALVAITAILIARAVAPVAQGEATLADVLPTIGAIAACFGLRALFHGLTERYAQRAGLAVISALRRQLLQQAAALGPRWLAAHGDDVSTLATRNLDDLQPYFVRYLPQLLLSAILTPATLIVVWWQDQLAATTLLIVIPLIPVFMWLVGVVTRGFANERMESLARLGSQVLDLIAGLPTLKALGRARGPAARIKQLSESQRRTTMETLRVAFLSGAILELLCTIGVAMVAVGVGLRLVYGGLSLEIGLAVIILAPEVLNPLRAVGTHFHASSDGMAAAEAAFSIMEQTPPVAGTTPIESVEGIEFSGVSIRAGDRDYFAPHNASGTLAAGTITAIIGPNGAGKTSLVLSLMGLVEPSYGTITLHSSSGHTPSSQTPSSQTPSSQTHLRDVDVESYWRHIAWVPQRPVFEPGTIETLLADSSGTLSPRAHEVAQQTGLAQVVESLPNGWKTAIGSGGVGLSLGQRQRLALTRALLEDRKVLFLDEPTAHLDEGGLGIIHNTMKAAAQSGKIVVIIAHRPSLIALADHTISLPAPGLPTPELPAPKIPASGLPDPDLPLPDMPQRDLSAHNPEGQER